MKNLFHQTKQAFFFSLFFYASSILFFVLKMSLAPMIFSVALLISMIFVFLVLREVMMSTLISNNQRILYILLVIGLNIFGGIIYFSALRDKVIGKQNSK